MKWPTLLSFNKKMMKTPQGATLSIMGFCSQCNQVKENDPWDNHTQREKYRYSMEVSIHIQVDLCRHKCKKSVDI